MVLSKAAKKASTIVTPTAARPVGTSAPLRSRLPSRCLPSASLTPVSSTSSTPTGMWCCTSKAKEEAPDTRHPARMTALCQTSASLAGKPRTRVPLHGVLGVTPDGVTAYSNEKDSHWTNEAHRDNNLFMGYKWQCVEFARRWLWEVKGLYLPSKNCAYCFAGLKHVYRPVPQSDSQDNKSGSTDGVTEEGSGGGESASSPTAAATAQPALSATDYSNVKWTESPCTYHRQGSHTAPVAGSLIIYPMSRGSPWGHIGVIIDVDLDRGAVYVADQNRFFHPWGEYGFSAVFRLDVEDGRHYIRDPESECKGWLVC